MDICNVCVVSSILTWSTNLWAVSAKGNTSHLHCEIKGSIPLLSTNFELSDNGTLAAILVGGKVSEV